MHSRIRTKTVTQPAMPPKRSTRSSTRASQKTNGDSGTAETKQQTLEETSAGVVNSETGEKKRSSPTKDETVSADDKKDGQRANKRQKQEAAEKGKIEGGAEGVDEQSEQAKAHGREIMENTETKKPSRGTLEKGTVYFWYKPKGAWETVYLSAGRSRSCARRRSQYKTLLLTLI